MFLCLLGCCKSFALQGENKFKFGAGLQIAAGKAAVPSIEQLKPLPDIGHANVILPVLKGYLPIEFPKQLLRETGAVVLDDGIQPATLLGGEVAHF